ncbi:MAG: hypothetical protein LBD51_10570 [Bifidobacteriaceae bacterium]|nr:hypothetical protein [Bifidobacteriaceae bacterium]
MSVAVGVPLLALGLLVAAGIGLFAHQQTKADSSAVRADLRLVATEVATYWADASDVPPVLARQDGQYYLCSADSDCPASFYASTPASQGVELRLKDSAKDAWCLEGRIEGGDWEVSMGPLSGLREGPCP